MLRQSGLRPPAGVGPEPILGMRAVAKRLALGTAATAQGHDRHGRNRFALVSFSYSHPRSKIARAAYFGKSPLDTPSVVRAAALLPAPALVPGRPGLQRMSPNFQKSRPRPGTALLRRDNRRDSLYGLSLGAKGVASASKYPVQTWVPASYNFSRNIVSFSPSTAAA